MNLSELNYHKALPAREFDELVGALVEQAMSDHLGHLPVSTPAAAPPPPD